MNIFWHDLIKVWIKFYYIFWFCHDTELSMHTIKRVSLFSIFISVGSFSCCFQRQDRNIWLFALRCALCRLKSWRICGAIKRKSEKIREMEESSKILFEETKQFDLIQKKNWPSALIEDLHVPPQCRPCSFNYLP